MKTSEMRDKPAAAQRAELLKLRKEQFALRLQRATGQTVKPDQFGKVRRNIARLKTAMRAQVQAQAAATKASGVKS
jgi:large subunit ribosomal protein L29